MPTINDQPRCPIVIRPQSPVRWALAATGLACFAIGGIAIFIPGLPTTVFLIVGSWCLTRSCPWLERKLLALPIFRPFLPYLQPGTPIPARARVVALVSMWAAISLSMYILHERDRLIAPLAIALPLAGAIGSIVILRYRRQAKPIQP